MIIMQDYIGFEWDLGNFDKNWDKHKVMPFECEQVFFNEPLLLYNDDKHSVEEDRMYVLGKTTASRKLFIVFTSRNGFIRIISARDMSKKERCIYEEKENTRL